MWNYTYTTTVVIQFDDYFEHTMTGSIDDIRCFIEWAVDAYGFSQADAFDKETGELIVQYRESMGG